MLTFLKRWLPLLLILAGLAAFFYFDLSQLMNFTQLKSHRFALLAWTESHYVEAVFIYMFVYILAVAISIPGAVFFTIISGFLFGVILGTLYVVVSATLGAMCVFLSVKTALEPWISKKTNHWINKMRVGFQKGAFQYLIFLRLAPFFPFWVVNIVPSLMGVRTSTFFLSTFIGIIPGSFVYVLLGNGLGKILDQNKTPNLGIFLTPQVFTPLLALALLSLLPTLLKWKKDKKANVMSKLLKCDIAIIGGGAGGLSVAAVAAQLGLSVVVVEGNKMGGDCLNYGCIPSKALIAAARSARGFLSSAPFGIEPQKPNVDFKRVMEHVANVINLIGRNDSVERFTTLGANIIHAHAEFIDENTIQAGHTLIKARKIVIASGSKPFVPLIPGLDSVSYLTNETIFTLCEKPSHLIVIGAGPIGCELAQAFCLLGIKVTLIDSMKIMPHDEPDLVEELRKQFICDGITLYEHHQITRVNHSDDGIDVFIEHQQTQHIIHGSHLLVATGRCPNITGLALEKAGIAYTSQGITVSPRLRTTNKRVYAIGDAAGGYQFTHIANYHAGIVIQNIIFKMPSKVDYRSIPWVTYTTPELAHTGLTAGEALKKHKDARVISLPFGNNDRAKTEHKTIGNIKVIVTKKGKILGCSILGEQAGELIVPWIMLIKEGKSLRNLTDLIIPYPTLSEVSKHIASQFYAPILFSNTVRRVVRFLKYLG